jgi:WD40 repeat protein/DNA-binding SARP family transcriptional activator
MRYRILGPIEVHGPDGVVVLAGNKLRAVLAVLLLHANEPVSADRLALALWGDDAAETATRTVRVHVSRLRRALGDGEIIATTPAGYCLRVRPDELDAAQFERLVEDGRRALAGGQPQLAATTLRDALGMWRGPALAELAFEPFARVEVNRLEEERLAALEARIEADLAIGQHAGIIAELQQLVAAHPTRERLAAQLMLALYRCGRQTDALEAYQNARRVLVVEIGVEPGPELRELQEAILRQDVALELDRGLPELPPELDVASASPLAGREEELAWLRLRWERARTGSGGLVILAGERGAGKSRLAAELGRDVHSAHNAVVYASGNDPAEAVLNVLRGLGDVTRPTLLVLDDADAADPDVLASLDLRTRSLANVPMLVLACCEQPDVLAELNSDVVLTLGPLAEQAVRTIGHHYASGKAPDEIPADWLLEASDGLPRRVHEVAAQWARREAARRVTVAAARADSERARLRTSQDDLVGGVVELQRAHGRILPPRASEPAVVCPFKGLASYDVSDAEYFFGRERLVAELVARLVGAPLLGVVGPSGSGKSSVLRAGLLPALAGGVLPGSERWRQALVRPGAHPLRELGTALADIDDGGDSGGRTVLAVDQFEETFTVCLDETERSEFVSELLHAAQDPSARYVVVLALRADYYGRCAAHPELSVLLAANNVLVGAMQRDELRRAVEGPCERAGLRVESELVEALVADVERAPGGLPLLSTALLELWQRRDGRHLLYSTYAQTGGVRGAVARLAEDAFGELDHAQQAVAESVLMRLVDSGEGDAVERRRVALEELEFDRDEDVARVVALLTDRRLLTVDAGTIEIAHEALLREWPRLRRWIEHNREELRIQRTLREAAREWDRLDRDEGALLRGTRLAEAIEWRDGRGPSLNELERNFLAASEAARERDRVTRRRRMVLAFGSLAAALLVISIVAVVSIVQGRRAASRELANRSEAVLDGDPGLALTIGLAALERSDTQEAQNAVRQATLADRTAAVIRAHESAIFRAALSSDDSLLATAGDDGSVRILSLAGARVVTTIKGSTGPLTDVAFSRDAKHVASASVGGEVAITELDGHARRVVLRLPGDPVYARSVEYDPQGRQLLVTVHDHDTIRLVGVGDSQARTLAGHQGVRVARFDPKGRRVVSAGEDGHARLWDLGGGAIASLRHGSDIFDARFSPDGRYVATAGADGAVRVWSASSGRLLQELALDLQPLYSVRFSTDGQRVVVGGADGVVRAVGVDGGPVMAELKGHRDRVYDAGFVGDGDRAFSVGTDGTARMWMLLKTATLPADEEQHPTAPSFSPDGTLVLSGYVGGRVRLWNPTTDAMRELPRHQAYSVAAYSANGARVLISGDAKRVRLYDVKRRSSAPVPVTAQEISAAAIERAGRRIALAGAAGLGDRTVIQSPDGRARVALPAHGQVLWLAFSPDAKHLLSTSQDGTVRIWDAASGASERILKAGEGGVLQAQYSPDGRSVAAAGADGTVRIWRLDGGEPAVFYGHDGPVTSVAFDRDGSQIVTGGKDGTVRLWDARGGHTRVVLRRHNGEVAGVAFSPDGRVLSGASDGIVVSPCEICGAFGDVLALAERRPRVTLSASERARLEGDGG